MCPHRGAARRLSVGRCRSHLRRSARSRGKIDGYSDSSQLPALGADVLLWSETVYPTPFGAPRSEDGAMFDAEIQAFVDAMGVPLLFGSYDLDAAGEYNAALLLEPGRGRVGAYRKTHLFPMTEYLPTWMDTPWIRRALPWTGDWQPGDGARLHLAVARFRSIETRLPQLRVTTNGLSALIDKTGGVPVQTAMGQQAVLTGVIAAHDPVPVPGSAASRSGGPRGHWA